VTATTIEEISETDLSSEIPCEATYEDGEHCGNPAEARISYACPVSTCLAGAPVVFLCAPCLDGFPDRVMAKCPVHGWVTPVLRRIL
jgi:hypothetical protein